MDEVNYSHSLTPLPKTKESSFVRSERREREGVVFLLRRFDWDWEEEPREGWGERSDSSSSSILDKEGGCDWRRSLFVDSRHPRLLLSIRLSLLLLHPLTGGVSLCVSAPSPPSSFKGQGLVLDSGPLSILDKEGRL